MTGEIYGTHKNNLKRLVEMTEVIPSMDSNGRKYWYYIVDGKRRELHSSEVLVFTANKTTYKLTNESLEFTLI